MSKTPDGPFLNRLKFELSGLKYLAFEINDNCPLTAVHKECPRNCDRFPSPVYVPPIGPVEIAEAANFAIDHGFDGWINVHYYNEPLATPAILQTVLMTVPRGKFSLWTNGLYLKDVSDAFLKQFVHVMVTIYPETPVDQLERLMGPDHTNVTFQRANLDGRAREDITPRFNPHITSCNRLDWEFIVDYYGEGHICCGDWRAEIEIGNIQVDRLEIFFDKWIYAKRKLRRVLSKITQSSFEKGSDTEIPDVCKLCLTRSPWISQV